MHYGAFIVSNKRPLKIYEVDKQTKRNQIIKFIYIIFYFSGAPPFSLRNAKPGDIVFFTQKRMGTNSEGQDRQFSRVTPLPQRNLAGRSSQALWTEVGIDLGEEHDVRCIKVTHDGVIVRRDDFELLVDLFTKFWDEVQSKDNKSRKVNGDILSLAIRAIWPGQSFSSICQPYGDEARRWNLFHQLRANAFVGKYPQSIIMSIYSIKNLHLSIAWV